MVERRSPIKVGEAVRRVMEWKQLGEIEYVDIDACDRRFLGKPLVADHDVPPFDRSPYDGFAVRSEDTADATSDSPVFLEVIDEIGAGQVSPFRVGKMEAIRIMTGAAIPEGADCVVMLELVHEEKRDGKTFIAIKRPFQKHDNISFKGEDAKKGQPLIEEGIQINPGVKALLATFGYAKVPVVKPPVVGVLATGSELLNVDEELVPGKIRNSNLYMIASQIERAGGKVKTYGQCADDVDSVLNAVKTAYKECDIVITTGGVSVGDFDYLPEIYRQMKAEVLFNKIAMRPGSVTTAAVLNGKMLFGLSGNPSACYVGFELYVRPLIRYWLHSSKPYLRQGKAFLQSEFPKANPFSRFVRSRVFYGEDGKLHVKPVGLDKSNVVTSLAWSDCLMVLPGGTRGFGSGDLVDVLFLEDNTGSESCWEESKRSSK